MGSRVGRSIRSAWVRGCVVVFMAAALSGCGGGGSGEGAVASSGASVIEELGNWFRGVRPSAAEFDQGAIDATRFEVRRPPPIEELVVLSRPGVETGRQASSSARQMTVHTNLTGREAKSLYCYFFSWYVKHGTLPTNQQEFEESLFSYIRGRVFRSTPAEKLSGIANLFREAIINAQSEGEAAARVAVATVCSLP